MTTYLAQDYEPRNRPFRLKTMAAEVAYTVVVVVAVSVLMAIILGGATNQEVRRLETENQRLKAAIRHCEADRDDALRMARQ